MKKLEIKVEVNTKGEITMETTNDGFTAPELIGLLELKKVDIVEQCVNPQKFIHRRKFKDEDGEWVEVKKGGEG
jgi:hypothetical protein